MHKILYLIAFLLSIQTSAAPWGDGECSNATRAAIQKSLGDISLSTGCPLASWKWRFFESETIQNRNAPVVIFDIGCNKGFDALSSLNLFTHNSTVGRAEWHKLTKFNCGACKQCHAEKAQVSHHAKGQPTVVYCAEPMPGTYHTLQSAASTFDLTARGLRVIHGAFTDLEDAEMRNWTAKFQAWPPLAGVETRGIGVERHPCRGRGCRYDKVQLYVVDEFVKQENITHVDIMSIDTEGNDPLVLLGANETLHVTSYVEFEYHILGKWAKTRLHDVISFLESKALVCYWIGQEKLWRITGCWNPQYDDKGWSNIGCVAKAAAEWYGIMEDIFNATMAA